MQDWFFNLTIIGLFYDMTGVVLIAYGVFWKSVNDVAGEAGTYWGFNLYVVRSLAKAQIDTIAGLALLVPGFFLQILGTLKVKPPEPFFWGLLVVWFVIVQAYVPRFREIIVEKRVTLIKDYLERKKEEEKNKDHQPPEL